MTKRPKRQPVKPDKAPRRSKLNVSLDAALARALKSYAAFHGLDACDVVARAITREISGFVVYQKTGDAEIAPDAPETPQERPTAPQVFRAG